MATTKAPEQQRDDEEAAQPRGKASISDRIAAFAMLDAMSETTQADKTLRLSLVGFGASEIAAMLQTTTAVVYQNLYEARKKAGDRKTRRRAAKSD